MRELVKPHGGGALNPLLLEGAALADEVRRAATLRKVQVSSRERGDILMLGIGGFTPLSGFMTQADWRGVCDGMRLASGLFWPISPPETSQGMRARNAPWNGLRGCVAQRSRAISSPSRSGLSAKVSR